MKRFLFLILSFGLFATAAYAHNGMEHVMGTVTAITQTSVSVKTMNGTDQTVTLSNDTKFLKGDTAINVKDIKVGDHIVIHASKKDGKLVAAEVKVGAMGSMKGMPLQHSSDRRFAGKYLCPDWAPGHLGSSEADLGRPW